MALACSFTSKKLLWAEPGRVQVTPRKTTIMRAAGLCFGFMELVSQYLVISHVIMAKDVKLDSVSTPGQTPARHVSQSSPPCQCSYL